MISTTLALDLDILHLVRSLSADRVIGLGDAVNQLLQSFGSDNVDQFFSSRQ